MNQELLQTFLSECGAAGPLQLVAQNPATGDTLRRTVEQPFAIVGRNPKADMPLSDEEVSHRHAYLQVYEGRVFCVDLKSRTGTHWDSGPQEFGWLEGKQAIRVGSYRIRRVDGEEGEEHGAPLVSRPLAPLGMSAVSLEFLPRNGDPELDEPLAHWKVQRVMALVGRGATCKVRLVHPSVSRVHCSLVRTPVGLWVVDLLGRKGTLVNGAPVSFALLADGDRLQIGRFLIRVRYEHPESDSSEGKDWEDYAVEEAEADSPSHIVMVSSAPSETPEPESSPEITPLPDPPSLLEEESGGGDGTSVEAANPSPDKPTPSAPASDGEGDGEVEACRTDFPSVSAPAQIESPSHESVILSVPSPLQKEEEEQVSTALAPSPPARLTQAKGRRSSRKRALVRSSDRALTKAEWMETILPAITDQFAQMQQQMFDQFQQGMFMMFRTFGQLHREQMDMVRQELDRIHQLTQQLHELQMELAKHPAAARDPAVQEMLAAIPPITSSPEAATLVPPEETWEAALRAKIGEREAKIDESHEQSPLVTPALAGDESKAEQQTTPPQEEPPLVAPAFAGNEDLLKAQTETQDESQVVAPALTGDDEEDEQEIAPPPPTQAAPAQNEDIHVLLCRQIAALQKERQSRWQRILRFLTGKSSSKPMP